MRKKASETAIKTSARKDIQENRAANLKKWRDQNPDEFYDKCTSKMSNCWRSKPEMMLFDVLKDIEEYRFKQNQIVKSDKFPTKSKRKQIDIGDKSKRTYIEFDGELHFKQTGLNQLDTVQEKDRLLDEHIIKHGWTLIRVGYDQFSYRKSDYGFKKECLERVFEILDNPTPGVHRIGAVYVNNR
jgi:very-short-patch-repair endonuclease